MGTLNNQGEFSTSRNFEIVIQSKIKDASQDTLKCQVLQVLQVILAHLRIDFRAFNLPQFLSAFFNKIGFFVGQALKNLKLCCHFLSWKSSERRNNLSYISVTYPGSAG